MHGPLKGFFHLIITLYVHVDLLLSQCMKTLLFSCWTQDVSKF